jgi:hypothetical protein
MIVICILIAMIIYVVWGSIYILRQINRINFKDEEEKVPDHGSYDDLLKYRRGRSKH